MKTFLVILVTILFLAFTTAAMAGVETVGWDAVPGADSYEIHQSADLGATWTIIATPPATACSGTPARCSTNLTLPATGYVLLRFAAKNAAGTTVRSWSGVWHCESCRPPAAAQNVGVQ